MKGAQLANRTLFVASVIVTGAIAGAFVWLLLFAMNLGITFIWDPVSYTHLDVYKRQAWMGMSSGMSVFSIMRAMESMRLPPNRRMRSSSSDR